MCGIAGVSGIHASHADLPCSLKRLRHRGPDGEGTFRDSIAAIALVHTRLAIQDPRPEADQPFADPTGTTVIVFNGEIYNVRELRLELAALGHTFRTEGDTEVLLLAYRQWGAECLARLNGIFAFALWDARSREMLVARDGVGVKPLYYSEDAGTFAFASEIKALLCFPWIERGLDPNALANYLRYLWCPGSGTPFRRVRKLGPGEALVVREGRIVRRWKFYELPISLPDEQRSIDDWVTGIFDTLSEAVRRQMISDVPLGAFLSGGLDSSAVVALARRHTNARLQCFTIDFDEEHAKREGIERDLPYAKRVARHLDVDLHVVHVGAEMAGQLEDMVWHLDEPQPDFAALNVMLISGMARQQGIKVLLSGAGGDDVFSGYRRHVAARFAPVSECDSCLVGSFAWARGGGAPQEVCGIASRRQGTSTSGTSAGSASRFLVRMGKFRDSAHFVRPRDPADRSRIESPYRCTARDARFGFRTTADAVVGTEVLRPITI